MVLILDIETASNLNVSDVGAPAYAEHPSTKMRCAVWGKFESRETIKTFRWLPGRELPSWVVGGVAAGEPVIAHNVGFELSILKELNLVGWPVVQLAQWIDTAQIAAAFSLPQNLEALAKTLAAPVQKDMEGNALMKALHRPHVVPTPEQMERLLDYCESDVLATGHCYVRLPRCTPTEKLLQIVDRRINARGLPLDRVMAESIRRLADERDKQIGSEVWAATGDIVSLTSLPMLKRFVAEHGVKLPTVRRKKNGVLTETTTLDRPMCEQLLADPTLPAQVRVVLAARVESGKLTSLAKTACVPEVATLDGRLKFSLRYHKAHTGRWASDGLQVHNLPKLDFPDVPKAEKAALIAALISCVQARDLAGVAKLRSNVLDALSKLLRTVIAVGPERDLIGADYSAIEARVVAWLAGQIDVLDIFHSGEDIYMHDARRVGSENRQLGKVQRLALGFGMSDLTFAEQVASYRISMPLKEVRKIRLGWRENNPMIVQFWRDLEEAAKSAIANPNQDFYVGPLRFRATALALRIQLPSGRTLHYWRPHWKTVERRMKVVDDAGNVKTKTVEMTELRFYRAKGSGMTVDSTYGGRLAENVTQATARDLLGEALLAFDETPYDVVVHVHDSIIAEVPAGFGSVEEFCSLMAAAPAWAAGLPVAVEGYRSKRFKG